MTLSKKHFIRVAEIIRKKKDVMDGKDLGVVRAIAWDLADYFAEENPLFDKERFLEACGK